MDEEHCAAAIRYVLLNPVRAGLAERAIDWPWSSARTHFGLEDDGATDPLPVARLWPDLAALLESAEEEEAMQRLRRAETVGRPLGGVEWIERLEQQSGRTLQAGRRGPRRRV